MTNVSAAALASCALVASPLRADSLRVGESLHGFVVREVADLPEVAAKMVRLEHSSSGADVVWLDRRDDNLTFAISFATYPEDDTGVAHILEHSVLCGSRKYRVREPFVELLKSSTATFLNALTYPDSTRYPVATRNRRDFLNLASVYLDAVFHPLSIETDDAFRQEGWHYDFDESGSLVRSGVVYSEMKGAFANPDTVAIHSLNRLLFPASTYGFVSGGDPAHIGELTFDGYKSFYRRHYHPSNARVFLDGSIDLDATLKLLDSSFAEYSPSERIAPPKVQPPVECARSERYSSDVETDRTILLDGWVFGSFRDRVKVMAVDILTDYLSDSNAAPIPESLLASNLCEDVSLSVDPGFQNVAYLHVKNVRDGKAGECRRLVRETIRRLAEAGLDHRRIAAKIDHLEFTLRECDSGTVPRGLAYLSAVMDSWQFGGNPADGLRFEHLFAQLRSGLESGLFERTLAEVFLENRHHAELTLVPSSTLAAERERGERELLARVASKLTTNEIERIRAEASSLEARQRAGDSASDLASLPRLELADLPAESSLPVAALAESNCVTLLRSPTELEGIAYVDIAFPLDALGDSELADVPLVAEALGELATANYSALQLQGEVDRCLGGLWTDVVSTESGAYLIVHSSSLSSRVADARRLIAETLLRTRWDDERAIADIRDQELTGMEQKIQSSGSSFAVRRALANFSAENRDSELIGGIAQLRHLQRSAHGDLAALARRIFVRKRGLVVAVTDNVGEGEAMSFAEILPAAGDDESVARRSLAPYEETGFETPAQVGFAAVGSHLPAGCEFCGSQLVAAHIVSLDWLWNKVRVEGGAYGTRLSVHTDGCLSFMSYRDPKIADSFDAFSKAGDALARFVESGKPLEQYQVAVAGKLDPYRSPRAKARWILDCYLSRHRPEFFARIRREVIATKRGDIAAFARNLTESASSSVRSAIAPASQLDACKFTRRERIAK